MESMTLTTLDEAREQIRTSLKNMETGYINIAREAVKTGYILRRVEDTGMLYHSGYSTIAEFAEAECGLNTTAVSRFIQMNEKYSVGGYSEEMDERYIGFDKSKLQEMLGLPDYIIKCLEPSMTRAQIREVAKEVQEEQKITGIEQALEQPEERVITLDTNIKRFLYAYYKQQEKAEEYVRLHKAAGVLAKIFYVLAPSGVASLVARVEGYGRMMLTISDPNKPLKLVNVRSGEFEEISWQEIQAAIKEVLIMSDMPEESWQQVYGEDFPVKMKEPVKKEEKQESKPVTEEKRKEKKPDKKADKKGPEPDLQNFEEQKQEEIAPAQQEDVVIEESPYIREKRDDIQKEYNALGEYIRQQRWKQARWSLRELHDMVEDIERVTRMEEQIPGQMEMEDVSEEREDSED